MKKKIEIKKVHIVQGAAIRRYTLDRKVPLQTLKLIGVYYEDGVLALHRFQFLKEGEVNANN